MTATLNKLLEFNSHKNDFCHFDCLFYTLLCPYSKSMFM